MILFFDTETTGKITNFKADPRTQPEAFPRIVQIAWAIAKDDGAPVGGREHLVKPDGWGVPQEATDVHGITTEMCEDAGIPIANALRLLADDIDRCHTIVAHNMAFDAPIVTCEMIRAGIRAGTKPERICTMLGATNYCGLPGNFGKPRWPTLQELHTVLFRAGFDGAHNTMADVLATAKCFFKLKTLGVL